MPSLFTYNAYYEHSPMFVDMHHKSFKRPTRKICDPFKSLYLNNRVSNWKTSRIMYGLLWIPIYCHAWGDSVKHLKSDEVTCENHYRIPSTVTKIGMYGNPCIILFLTRYCVPWSSTQTSLQFNRWRHAKARDWHCDVIFVDCSSSSQWNIQYSCTCRLEY